MLLSSIIDAEYHISCTTTFLCKNKKYLPTEKPDFGMKDEQLLTKSYLLGYFTLFY